MSIILKDNKNQCIRTKNNHVSSVITVINRNQIELIFTLEVMLFTALFFVIFWSIAYDDLLSSTNYKHEAQSNIPMIPS